MKSIQLALNGNTENYPQMPQAHTHTRSHTYHTDALKPSLLRMQTPKSTQISTKCIYKHTHTHSRRDNFLVNLRTML